MVTKTIRKSVSKPSKPRTRSTAPSGALLATGVETSAVAILKAVVSSLEDTVVRTEPRRFFPDGIGLISLELTIGTAKVALRITTDAKSSQPSAPSPILMAESCRGSLRFIAGDDLSVGEKVPANMETAICGPIKKKIKRTDPEFKQLVSNNNSDIISKDEEGNGADRMMSVRMQEKLNALAASVKSEWSDSRLRVTEAWDENGEHTGNSLHYEGRAADLTTSPIDNGKLGRLGRLAVDAGFDWVWYENALHVHASVK
jgi:Hedgehog amino-terminal signalling domain